MSLKTWIKEFYLKDAADFADFDGNKKSVRIAALKHSIKKWTGLTRDNLRKHKLGDCYKETDLLDILTDDPDNILSIDSESCSLCQLFSRDWPTPACHNCPLKVSLGAPCYESRQPYKIFEDGKGPKSMINALKTALRKENERN